MRYAGWVTFTLLLSVVIGLIIWFSIGSDYQGKQKIPVTASTATVAFTTDLPKANTVAPANSIFKTGLENLPKSLQGTDIDGEILIDEQKNLHVTKRLRDLFDYFLSTLGEESLQTIVDRVRAYVQHRVPEPAAGQVLALFDRYLAYRNALKQVHEAGGKNMDQIDPDAIERQKAQEKSLREQYFNAEQIQAFFGDEDALDRFSLQSLRINQDKNLSEAEKARQLNELSSQLPDNMQQHLKTAVQGQQLQALTEEWKKRGGSAAELRQIRQNLVGVPATERLENLDQQRAEWQQRIDQYLGQREQILNNKNLSEAQQQQQLAALQQERFDEAEQQRLPAFEQGFKQLIP